MFLKSFFTKISKDGQNTSTEQQNSTENEKTFTCEICIEPYSSDQMFKNNERCMHSFCMDCMAHYIKVQIEERKANVDCPGLDCDQLLDPLTCSPFITAEIFNKWTDFLCESVVLEYQRCSCPNKNCLELIINECNKNTTKCNCPRCNWLFCFQCKIPWHAGFRCDETDQTRTKDDVNFGRLLEQKKWTRCPRCGQPAELIKGCSRVRCRCGQLFCYKCGRKDHNFTECATIDENQQVNCNPFFFLFGIFLMLLVFFFSVTIAA